LIYQPYTLAIALRYLRASSRNTFISFISLVSMLGIALAVAVLITVMSVMNGFETELQRRILGMAADASLIGPDRPLADWQALRRAALSRSDVLAVAPVIEGQGMLAGSDRLLGVSVRGVDPELERDVTTLGDLMLAGELDDLVPGAWNMAIGSELGRELGVGVGDQLELLLPEARVTPAGLVPRMRSFTVSAVFEVGMYEYDRGLVVLHMDDASVLFRTGGQATAINLKVDDIYFARSIITDLATDLGGDFYISDWTFRHVNVFRSIQLTKPILFIMLSLVIGVAAFNIVSTLVMVVREKRGDIAILRSFGATPRSILGIFACQGSAIGVIGTLAGVLVGLLAVNNLEGVVSLIESVFAIDLLAADVYLLGDLPTEARFPEILQISALAFSLAVLATLYPALLASKQQPAEALRYE
jgi:lipoprotein-releasing system permease protein